MQKTSTEAAGYQTGTFAMKSNLNDKSVLLKLNIKTKWATRLLLESMANQASSSGIAGCHQCKLWPRS
jgi:hypothetical protein